MKIYTFKIYMAILLAVFISITTISAQVHLKESSLESQIENSSLVVEGRVISKTSFWDDKKSNIYTSNLIEVTKVFKGHVIKTIEVITEGGTVGLMAEIVTPSLKLQSNEIGLFMLYESDLKLTSKSDNKQYKPFGSLQGFYKYNIYDDVVINPFNRKKGISNVFYKEIMNITKTDFIELAPLIINNNATATSKGILLPPTAITFTPTTATAGTGAVLTINGSGFGAVKGKVGFTNADSGGLNNGLPDYVDALDSQVLTWNDTQITVEVPSEAGTGKIRVTDNLGAQASSSGILTITYSEINVPSSAIGGIVKDYRVQHVNDNSSGGYTWQMFTDFNNSAPAKDAFIRALDTWRCETGVNWIIGNITVFDFASSDGVNVVRFDNGSELPNNVLARCTSYYNGCTAGGGTTVNWFVSELDIVFDDDTNWFYGTGLPGFTQYDFQSVALHELGHGHQLAHIIDPVSDGDNQDDVMHYAISNGESQKVLLNNNIIAANGVQSRSTNTIVCTQPLMTNHPCSLSVEEEELRNSISIYPNPSKGEFFIKNASFISLEKAEVYDVSGRQIINKNFINTSGNQIINLTSMSSGVYFLNIYSERAMITKKLILD